MQQKEENSVEQLYNKLEQYIDSAVKLYSAKAVDKFSDISSNLISWSLVLSVAILFFTMLNISIALYLGDLFGKLYLGFLAVTAFYALITLIFIIIRKSVVKRTVANNIISAFID